MRLAIKEGVEQIKEKKTSSASVFLKLAEMGKKYKLRGPKDLSSNLDKYLWDNYDV